MLKHEDIFLRSVENKDADLLYKAINQPDLVRFNAPFAPVHEVCHLEWLSTLLKDKSKEFFLIEMAGKPVGAIQLFDINLIHRSAELQIRLFEGKNFGKGIGSKAVTALCNHAFIDLGLVRVWLRVFANNERAIASYKKSGFLIEGIMKRAAFINGAFEDVIMMAKLNLSQF